MIGNTTMTAGRTFEKIVFNDKNPSRNPITGETLAPTPFHTRTQGFTGAGPANVQLPSLNLNSVYIITGPGTCSASESIINSLRGVGVQVYLIGSTTCGKPYGFYPTDNCGTTYFSIQFRGENAANFGDYTDGFSPANTPTNAGTSVPGCSVADDFNHALGDVGEARIAAALGFRASNNQTCPVAERRVGPALVQGVVRFGGRQKPVGVEARGAPQPHRSQDVIDTGTRLRREARPRSSATRFAGTPPGPSSPARRA